MKSRFKINPRGQNTGGDLAFDFRERSGNERTFKNGGRDEAKRNTFILAKN